MTKPILITGGAGFFGSILKNELLQKGHHCVSVDLVPDADTHPHLVSIRGDITDRALMEQLFSVHRFGTVFHVAALLAHECLSAAQIMRANVDGTRVIAELSARYGTGKIIYTSSNCLFGRGFSTPITEEQPPCPVEIYGTSKWEGEKILLSGSVPAVIFRCPTIIAASRLGLLAILFEFIRENRKVWVVGKGDNRYQFIHALDLATACIAAMETPASGVFNIGSDNVPTLRGAYEYVIELAGSRSRVASLPKGPTLFAMKLCHVLKLSPLGPYHYKMIAENFLFDTTHIKRELNWRPTKTNHDMLLESYNYYLTRHMSAYDPSVSAHKRAAKMGIITLLKWLS